MTIRSVIPVLAAGVAALGVAAPAVASSAGRGQPLRAGAAGSPVARVTGTRVKSTSFAGYEISDAGRGMTVTTTIVVPKVQSCTQTNQGVAASAGVDVKTVSNYSDVDLFIGCLNGKARYFPALTVNRTETNYTTVSAHPGDKVVLRTAVGAKHTIVSVDDLTAKVKKTEQGTGAGPSGGTGYPWVGDVGWDFHPGALTPVPGFGKISFSGSKINGSAFATFKSPALLEVDRYDSTETTLKIATSNFASNGESFTTTFKHS